MRELDGLEEVEVIDDDLGVVVAAHEARVKVGEDETELSIAVDVCEQLTAADVLGLGVEETSVGSG